MCKLYILYDNNLFSDLFLSSWVIFIWWDSFLGMETSGGTRAREKTSDWQRDWEKKKAAENLLARLILHLFCHSVAYHAVLLLCL